jgi:hypothetical protein
MFQEQNVFWDVLKVLGKMALALPVIFLIISIYYYLFETTYICKGGNDELYILKLAPDGVVRVYDQNSNFISATKYYYTGKNKFIGENGWWGLPGMSEDMVVAYRDKTGKLVEFYSGCNKKTSYY